MSLIASTLLVVKTENKYQNSIKKTIWLYESSVILNIEKGHYTGMDKDVGENKTLQMLGQEKTINSKEVESLGITIDEKLSFHHHIKNICKKAGRKQKALLKPKT